MIKENLILNQNHKMKIRKFIIIQGIPGSGKSFYSRELLSNMGSDTTVRVNMDDIRNMLGDYWVPKRERLVKRIMNNTIIESIFSGYNIIIDNTNLNDETLNEFESLVKECNANDLIECKYEIEYRLINTPLNICIERDLKRENPVGKKVIEDFYQKYKHKLNNEKT